MYARTQKYRRGAVLVTVAIRLPVLIGVIALNSGGGRMCDERRRARAAADAARAAGADLYTNYWTNHGADPTESPRAAAAAAEQVALANGPPVPAVTANIPRLPEPTRGTPPRVADVRAVE